jgi:8-oxo-dGTP pyrophosphatase MutT (NUDIX family)
LITSIRRGRWIIPKGIVEPHLSPAESACKEAWEEAGVMGQVDSKPLGSYQYVKWGRVCRVRVFLLRVQTVYDQWPEQMYRRRQWMTTPEAAKAVEEVGLSDLIRKAADRLVSVTD